MYIYILHVTDSHIDDIIEVFKNSKDAIKYCKQTIKDVKRKTALIIETNEYQLETDILYNAETNDGDTYGYVEKIKLQ